MKSRATRVEMALAREAADANRAYIEPRVVERYVRIRQDDEGRELGRWGNEPFRDEAGNPCYLLRLMPMGVNDPRWRVTAYSLDVNSSYRRVYRDEQSARRAFEAIGNFTMKKTLRSQYGMEVY